MTHYLWDKELLPTTGFKAKVSFKFYRNAHLFPQLVHCTRVSSTQRETILLPLLESIKM